MKIPSSVPGKQKRYTSNIRRSKDRQARSGSHSSAEELTASLLDNYDEEIGNEEEEEVILNYHENHKVRPYPELITESKKGKISGASKQRKETRRGEDSISHSSLLKDEIRERSDSTGSLKEAEPLNQMATFEVEDPEKHDASRLDRPHEKKKHFLSGKPLIGMYDRKRVDPSDTKKDTLATRWLQAQQPKHNEIFHQQDGIENYNVDRSDGTSTAYRQNQPAEEGEAFNTLLDKHFSHSTAVRHFNESMPVSPFLFFKVMYLGACSPFWFFS